MTTQAVQHDQYLASCQGTATTVALTYTVSVDEELVNVFTLAKRFNVHYRTAQRWTKNKWIPHYRVGKSIRYSLSEVLEAVSSNVG